MKCGNLNFLEPSGPLQACNGTALSCYYSKQLYITVLLISSTRHRHMSRRAWRLSEKFGDICPTDFREILQYAKPANCKSFTSSPLPIILSSLCVTLILGFVLSPLAVFIIIYQSNCFYHYIPVQLFLSLYTSPLSSCKFEDS